MAKKRFQTTSDIARAINDVFGQARSSRLTHEELCNRFDDILRELATRTPKGARRYSEYESAFARGYKQARYDDIWKELEFCYRDSAGVLFSVDKQSTHRKTEEYFAAGRGAELGNLDCTHVWKGTDKPFCPWETMAMRKSRGD